MTRPLLFLDVDGPLIPFGGKITEYADVELSNPLLARVNPALGPELLSLGCDLIWATTWMDRAAESPFVWIDDEITDIDRAWVATHHPGPALLHAVTPSIGLTTDDIHEIATWLEGM